MLASRFWGGCSKPASVLFEEIAQFRKVYQQEPFNKENLMNWASNAKSMMHLPNSDRYDNRPMNRLKECISKLEKALTDPHAPKDPDPEPWFMLGASHYCLYLNKSVECSLTISPKTYMEHATRGAACLRTSLKLEPNYHDSRIMLKGMKNHWCQFVPPPDSEEEALLEDVWEEEFSEPDVPDNDEDYFLAREIEIAEAKDMKNPNDADNLKSWGAALLELASYKQFDEKKEMFSKAVVKLEKSLELNPGNQETKLDLVRAQLHLRIPRVYGDAEYVRLVKEYRTLTKGNILHGGKTCSSGLNTCCVGFPLLIRRPWKCKVGQASNCQYKQT